MIGVARAYLRRGRVTMGLARAAAGAAARELDATNPDTWEFSAFSVGGEDGILDYLTRRLTSPNRYFVEIGASDGLANCTAWLALGRRYAGLMVDADPKSIRRAKHLMARLNPAVECVELVASEDSARDVVRRLREGDPDVFSLDIDGDDYHVAAALFEHGMRPRIAVVEYNSAFGPDRPVAVRPSRAQRPPLCYGASIAAWRNLFRRYGYRFVTVESNGVNAFFADPGSVHDGFLDDVVGVPFRENRFQRRFGESWQQQAAAIPDEELVEVD